MLPSKIRPSLIRISLFITEGSTSAYPAEVSGPKPPNRFSSCGRRVHPTSRRIIGNCVRSWNRRAERRTVTLVGAESTEGGNAVPYLNRLADYLFMLARAAEQNWTPSRGGMS